jgi:hypothetical protein
MIINLELQAEAQIHFNDAQDLADAEALLWIATALIGGRFLDA